MDFGLGLILSFTDNASAGIQNAVNNLNSLTQTAEGAMSSMNQMASLSALSVVSNQIGNSFTSAGGKIISMLGNVMGNVQSTGSEFESFKLTLDKLYGTAEESDRAMSKLLDFSVSSPFEVDEVKDMLIVLKSQGIDAFEELTGASSGFRQENLAWIADIMAFKPDEATSRWKRALTNYIGSAQPLMLRNLLDMGDIDEILGHDMGETTAERMSDIMEIVEKLNLQGYADEMSKTMAGMQSNVSDAMTKLYKSIADTGVYDKLKQSFASLKGVLLGLEDDEIQTIGETIGGAFKIILEPVTHVASAVDSLLHNVVAFAQTNPGITKWGIVFTAVAGVFLMFIGVALKLTSALSGVSLMYMAFGQQFGSLATLFRTGSLKIISSLLPLTLTIGLLYTIWKNDLGGIQTSVKTFTSNVIGAFQNARSGVSGSLVDLNTALRVYDKDSFFGGLSKAIMRVMVLGQALVQGWNGFTLDYSTYEKAERLGILPLIERIFDFLYRFRLFKQGFLEGLDEILTRVKTFFSNIAGAVDGTIFDSFFNGLTKFFAALSNNDADTWERFGNIVGKVVATVLLAKTGFSLLSKVMSPFIAIGKNVYEVFKILSGDFSAPLTLAGKTIWKVVNLVIKSIVKVMNFVGQVGPTVSGLFSNIGTVFSTVGQGIARVVNVVTSLWNRFFSLSGILSNVWGAIQKVAQAFSFFRNIVSAVVSFVTTGFGAGIIAVIASVVAFAVTHWDEFKRRVLFVWDTVKEQVGNVLESIKTNFLSVWENLKSKLESVSEKFNWFKGVVQDAMSSLSESPAFQAIINVLSTIGNILTAVIVPIVTSVVIFVSNRLQYIFNQVSTIFNTIINIISDIMNGILETIGGVIELVVGLFTLDLGKILDGIQNIFGGIFGTFVDIGADILAGLGEGLWNALTAVIKTVSEIVGNIIDHVKGLFGVHSPSTVFDEIGGNCMDGLGQGVEKKKGFISTVLGGVKDLATKIFSGIGNTISNLVGGSSDSTSEGFNQSTEASTKALNNLQSNATKVWNNILTLTNKSVTNMNTTVAKGYTTMTKNTTTAMTTMKTAITSTFTSMKTSISTSMSSAVSAVSSGLRSMQTAFSNIKLELPKFQIPHFSVTGSLNLTTPTTVPQINVDWYAKGGVFNQPTVIGVGEQGKEAVMPLESNTGWIGALAHELTGNLIENTNRLRPVANNIQNQVTNSTSGDDKATYVTRSTGNTDSHDVSEDNRIYFNEGSIVVQVMSASESEAERLATLIMEKIKRKQELENMRNYQHVRA